MSIDWYPGHMNKARRVIAEALPSKDVVLEVLDARMPAASTNPVFAKLRRDKPCIKILSKSDLADPIITQAWIRHFEEEAAGSVVAIALSKTRPAETRARIAELCKRMAPHRKGPLKTIRAMVVGIPNVGKSTLINTLMERNVAKVSDKPAVTRAEQLVTLKNGITLSDNPGILARRMDEAATLRLALGGAIPDTALDYQSVGLFAAGYLARVYPSLLCSRFKLASLPDAPDLVLEAIGRKRGCLRPGGVVDLHKAADILVHEFRAGTLGPISLEAPGDASEQSPEQDASEQDASEQDTAETSGDGPEPAR